MTDTSRPAQRAPLGPCTQAELDAWNAKVACTDKDAQLLLAWMDRALKAEAEAGLRRKFLARAERALTRAGWTYTEGAQEWKPPLGPSATPLLDEIDRLRSQVERQPYPGPTQSMLDNNPLFDAIWNAIKGWDISRYNDGLYSGPDGNDARHIYDAVVPAFIKGDGQ